jgi:DNA invertase Pin-like site-specific DNA recombinase
MSQTEATPLEPLESRRTVLYLRVSSKSQVDTDYDPEGLSIPAQREICRRRAESLGLEVVGEYVELGRTATTVQNRPEFQAMMQRISSQRDIDYVMVYQLSRLNRNRVDDAMVMLQMDAVGAKLLSATENIDDTPTGQLTRGILSAVNQYRSASEGEDIARKLAHKAKLGGTIGRARLGYLNVKEDVDGRLVSTVALDEERAALIRKGFELYAEGDCSLTKLAQTMADLGLKTRKTRRHPRAEAVSVNKWHLMLQDPYYMGLVTYKGQVYPGRHEALVSPELFAKVQDVLAERSAATRRDRTHFHYLKKQLYCGRCRDKKRTSHLVYTEAKGAGGTYGYFFCMARKQGQCDLPYLPVRDVEEAVVRHYQTHVTLSDDFRTETAGHLAAVVADEQAALRELHEAVAKRLADLDTREERLIDLAEQGLPQHKIRQRLTKLYADRARLNDELSATGAQLALGAERLNQAMELLRDIAMLYATTVDEVRGLLNAALFSRFYVEEDGVRAGLLRPPFDEIAEAEQDWALSRAVAGEERRRTTYERAPAGSRGSVVSLSDALGFSEASNLTSSSKRSRG